MGNPNGPYVLLRSLLNIVQTIIQTRSNNQYNYAYKHWQGFRYAQSKRA